MQHLGCMQRPGGAGRFAPARDPCRPSLQSVRAVDHELAAKHAASPGLERIGNMDQDWQYQLRIYLPNELAEIARRDPTDAALGSLPAILARHHATMRCQLDAFADYVAEAERQGIDHYPLYQWTKATIADPVKRAKHLQSFALYVNGREVYAKDVTEALEADLQPLVGGPLVTRMSKHDTNPANNPQPPAQYRRDEARAR